MVPVNNAEYLADKIIKALKNPELLNKMGRAGRAMVKDDFLWEKVVSRIALSLDAINQEGK